QLGHHCLCHPHLDGLRGFGVVSGMVRFRQIGGTMNNGKNSRISVAKPGVRSAVFEDYQLLFFSELLDRPIRLDKTQRKNGRLTDLVFRLSEPYPEPVGIYVEHGRGYPSELIPWDKVARIQKEAIYITPNPAGGPYPKFVDQQGWILL